MTTRDNEVDDISFVMHELDRWVAARGSGNYVPADYVSTADADFSLVEDFGIQQVREEILAFGELLMKRQRRGCLEIGLGYFGSTHFFWRLLFRHVSTVEQQKDRVFLFRENCRLFYGRHLLDQGKSAFFFGSSSSPAIFRAVREHVAASGEPLDLLFIDGDHRYDAVLVDWLLYSHLVAPGGIVAFHDAVAGISGAGVPRLIRELESGAIDGERRDIQKLVLSKDCGIAYYVQRDAGRGA